MNHNLFRFGSNGAHFEILKRPPSDLADLHMRHRFNERLEQINNPDYDHQSYGSLGDYLLGLADDSDDSDDSQKSQIIGRLSGTQIIPETQYE